MDFDLDVRPITYSEVNPDGYLGLQVQLPGANAKNASKLCTPMLPYGYFARPSDSKFGADGAVDASQASQGFVVWIGGEAFVMPMANPSLTADMPNLHKGDVGIAANGATFMKAGADGALTRYTTDDGTVKGQPVYDRIAKTGRTFVSPLGTMRHDFTGYHLTTAGGARIDLGAVYGLPSIIASLTSYARIEAATVTLAASLVKLGGAGGSPLAIARVLVNFLHAAFNTPSLVGGTAALAAGLAAAAAAEATPIPIAVNEPLYELLATRRVVGS